MNSFVELFNFLKTNESDNIKIWLEDSWIGKDKQESLLRLFSKLKLIKKLEDYNICNGNFNLNSIKIIKNVNEIFYDNQNNLIKLKDNGDSSDLTCINKNNNEVLAISSKNLNNYQIGNLDIEKLIINSGNYNLRIGLCVKSKSEIIKTINNARPNK